MKTPGLIAQIEDNHIILKHPDPSLACSPDDDLGDTKDLHDLVEDLDRRDFLIESIFTDDNSPLANWSNKKLITYDILREEFPSIMHHFGECTANYCIMSRSVNPLVRPAIEEIFVEEILKYTKYNKRNILDVAIYGIGGFFMELLILTRVVRQLKLKNLRLHLTNETMGELYEHIKRIKQTHTSKSNDSTDDDSESGSETDSDQPIPVLINDIVDTSDTKSRHQKTNYFRIQYAKLCAISEWFSATGFTNCEIVIYDKFESMKNYTFDIFMGIDFVEEFITPQRMSQIHYISMLTSKLILLAHKDNSVFLNTPYHYTKIAVVNNNKTHQNMIDAVNAIDVKIRDATKLANDSIKVYRPVSLKNGVYKLSNSSFSSKYHIRLLNETESDESINVRLNTPNAEIVPNMRNYSFSIGSNSVFIKDTTLINRVETLISEQSAYIEKRFSELDIRIHNNNSVYWRVLKTKSLIDGVKMICMTYIGVFLVILIGFGEVFEQLFGICHRRLSGKYIPDSMLWDNMARQNPRRICTNNSDDENSDDVDETILPIIYGSEDEYEDSYESDNIIVTGDVAKFLDDDDDDVNKED